MKLILDPKSLVIGLATAGCAFFLIGSKSQQESDNGKFQTEIRPNGIVILNTQNGDYLFAADMIDIRRNQWIKGEFYKTFNKLEDNKK
ncbi:MULTISPECIES: hypothetical protein [Pedobacter]|uniref:hypothetical protein n=1 Tax=Pedobacter TaxID=84567 RepID=UPI001E45B2BC|nr:MULTISPECIES: hypothetical protein [Pedobacter]